MAIYESDPDRAPDDEFEPGTLEHLVAGNTGRMLDHRRTPVKVLGVREETAWFRLRVEGFEDEGAVWDVPFDQVHHYQFARGSRRVKPDTARNYAEAAKRFDRLLAIDPDPAARAATGARVARECVTAAMWLEENSGFLGGGERLHLGERDGSPRLAADLGAWMEERGVADVEEAFAARFVSNPYSGEIVKAHRVVLAELGLAPFRDTVLRDPASLAGAWKRERRERHIVVRLAFLRAFFAAVGVEAVPLFRGIGLRGPYQRRRGHTFVSTSFHRPVAESHYGDGATGLFLADRVPVERLFLTHLETAAMNRQFREAEAVLLEDLSAALF